MRNDRIVPGLILVLIGSAFLLHNYGVINFHWMNFVYLWPIFIVIGGVNLIFANNRSPWATAIKVGVVILGFCLLAFGNFGNRYHFWPNHTYNYNNDSDDNDDEDDNDSTSNKSGINITKQEGHSIFSEEYVAGTRVAELNISGGGTTYNLSDTTNQLFVANTDEFFGKYELTHHKQDSVYVLDFDMKKLHTNHFTWSDKNKGNTATFKLNPNPEWKINVEAGATETNLDLSKFKVRSVKLSGGAASFHLKLGQPLASTNVEVSTGMSEVVISIPRNAACNISSDSGLSSNQFDGFSKKSDDTYETTGYANAKNKIHVNISGGMSDFKVTRY